MAAAKPSTKPAAGAPAKAAPAKATPAKASPVKSAPSIMDRLKDWLMEPATPAPAGKEQKSGGKAAGKTPTKAPPTVPQLAADRWVLYQKIWGEGFSYPGDRFYALELVKPFNLKPAMTVLDLAAGLGGGARAMVEVFDMWVSCMEPDPEIAAAAKAISAQKGLEKRAPMEPYDISKPLNLPPAKYDCILMRETLHEFTQKQDTLKAIKHALKPNGQVIVTDFVVANSTERSREFQRWQELWPLKPDPWTKDACVECLKNLEFSVHIMQEESSIYRGLVLHGWTQFMQHLNRAELSKEFLKLLATEIERWNHLAHMLETGEMTYLRMHLSRKSMRLPSDP